MDDADRIAREPLTLEAFIADRRRQGRPASLAEWDERRAACDCVGLDAVGAVCHCLGGREWFAAKVAELERGAEK